MLSHLFKSVFGDKTPAEEGGHRLAAWAAWLAPISESAAVGQDPAYEDEFLAIKEELGKLSGQDDGLILSASERLLKESGKDLRLAAYYAYARLRTDGAQGLADGLELIAALVSHFGEALYPARPEGKRIALEWLNSARFLERLEQVGSLPREQLERAIAALALLESHTQHWNDAARPDLTPLLQRFKTPLLNRTPEPIAAPTQNTDPPSTGRSKISSSRELLEQGRLMSAYLREQANGYLPAYRLIRALRWDTVHDLPPHDATGQTRLVGPRQELRQHLKRLLLQQQWQELMERVELAFVEGANHFWLDLQYYAYQAQTHVGAPYLVWRELLLADFAQMLDRLPGLPQLRFADGSPLAEDSSLEWISRHAIVRDLSAEEAPSPLPAVAGTHHEWQETEIQASELASSQGLQAAFLWLDGLPGKQDARSRVLSRMLMARLAAQYSKAEMADSLYAEAERSLKQLPAWQWERELAFELKHSQLKLLRLKSGRKELDRNALAQEIEAIHAELSILNPAKALSLN